MVFWNVKHQCMCAVCELFLGDCMLALACKLTFCKLSSI